MLLRLNAQLFLYIQKTHFEQDKGRFSPDDLVSAFPILITVSLKILTGVNIQSPHSLPRFSIVYRSGITKV